MRLLFVLVVVSAAIFHYAESYCPDRMSIIPCGCSNPDRPFLLCVNVFDFNTLNRIFANSAGYSFDAITLQAFTVPYLPYDLFKETPTNMLNILGVDVNRIFDGLPVGLESTKDLYMQQVKFRNGANWEFLSTLTSLEKFTIWSVPMKVIKKDLGQYATVNLKNLYMRATSTRSIKPGAFEKLTNLKEFVLQNTDLAEIRRDIFPNPFNSIEYISFDGSSLTTLPDGMFENMPNLYKVVLNYSALKSINSNQFRGLSRSLVLEIKRSSSFQCDRHLCWLKDNSRILLDGECYAPEKFKYRFFRDLTKADLHCS